MKANGNDKNVMIPGRSRTISYILKFIVIVSAAAGVFLSAMAGRNTFMGGNRVFMYFTIQSNIAVAVILAAEAVMMQKTGGIKNSWFTVKFMGTVSIILTGAVFCFVLAPVFGPWAWNLQNILTHVVVPIAAAADFFVTGIYGDIRKSIVFYGTLPPLAYALYAGIAYLAGWEFSEGINYPYFFLNWGSPAGAFGFTDELPYMGCVWWILALLFMLVVVGYICLLMLDLLRTITNRKVHI